jgi:mannose-1-phosphate guanylyltransferase/mannose-6-phosphate isomerase
MAAGAAHQKSQTITAAILSGCSDSRLWPTSCALYRKLLSATVCAGNGMAGRHLARFVAQYIIFNDEYHFIIANELRRSEITPQAMILEPLDRNTAPVACVAALMLTASDPDALLFGMPSDHAITDTAAFGGRAGSCKVADFIENRSGGTGAYLWNCDSFLIPA